MTRSLGSPAALRALGYIRVSTEDQASSGLGLEAQRHSIAVECRRRGWELVETFEDAGASGKSLKGRQGLQACLLSLQEGVGHVLVVAKLDRLSRSILDFATLMQKSQHEGWALVTLDLGVDTTSPSGEMIANIMATFAQFERRLIGQRTKDALAVRRRQGVKLGRPRLVAESLVDRLIADRTSGQSLRAIAESLNADGVPPVQGGARWYASTVRSVLASAGTIPTR